MALNYLNKYAEQRTRIAKGARRQLYTYLNAHDAVSAQSFKLNRMMLATNGKVRKNRLRKAPTVFNDMYTDNTAFSTYMYHTTATRRRNADDLEFFNDEGIEVLIANQTCSKLKRVMITHHAVLRAFERGLWMFKDKPVSEWVGLFAECALFNRYESGLKYEASDFTEDTCTIETSGLNSVVQRSGRNADIIILTFTPGTGKEDK